MLLTDFLHASAQQHPGKIAIVTEDGRITYGELWRKAVGLASSMVDGGVRRGDRVLIWVDNGLEACVSVFGALLAGAGFIPLNPTSKQRRADFIVEDAEPTGAVIPKRQEEWVAVCAERRNSLRWAGIVGGDPGQPHYGELRAQSFEEAVCAEALPLPRVIDVDLAAIIYTSGSTNLPKGVVCPHANMAAAATSIASYLENKADDIVLNALPLSFDYGLYQLLMCVKFGGTLVLEKSFAFPYVIAERIAQERVTGLPGVPTLFAMLVGLDLSALDLSSVRYLSNTGAAVSPQLIERIREAFPRARFYSMFGLTECKRICYLPPEQLDRRPGSVGKAMPNCETYLADTDGNPLNEPGKPGILMVRGANVMNGYWRRPEETAHTYRPGRLPGERVLYTGDLFRQDEEGYLYFLGRADEMLKSRGEKVSPREVESIIEELPEVEECGVAGVPDEVLGMKIVALISPRKGCALTEEQILRHCSKNLEPYMVPARAFLCERLSHSANGKLRREDLAQLAASLMAEPGG